MRGAGPHGLASIEPRRPYGEGWLVRPLLDVGRAALETYAREQHLTWIEDPANTDTTFDRNFLRHRVLPVLRERWPGLSETIPRAARLSGEAARMLVYRVIDLRSKGHPPTADTNVARVAGTLAERAVSDLALEIFGPDALEYGSFADSHFRLAMTAGVAVGTTEINLNLVANRFLGLPRE